MPFSLQFLGVGGAFSLPAVPGDLTTAPMQSNMVITSCGGARLLFDCGTDIRYSAQMCGYGPESFQAVYISHLHADHEGGLEWFLLNRLFTEGPRPFLFGEEEVLHNLWKVRRHGLGVTPRGLMGSQDYFVACPVDMEDEAQGGRVLWEGLELRLVRQIHVPHPTQPMVSYGLIVKDPQGSAIFISADTNFNGKQISAVASEVSWLFHDCEVGSRTGYHAHYDELLTLPPEIRRKMWLYHYNPAEAAKKDAAADGFCGFVRRGQIFSFE